jgi:hypothetical protein
MFSQSISNSHCGAFVSSSSVAFEAAEVDLGMSSRCVEGGWHGRDNDKDNGGLEALLEVIMMRY